VLLAIRNGEDARVLTMLGYSKRKLGWIEEGIADYQKALAIDPDNADAREYLGEAYVETGRHDLARLELEKFDAICGGRSCEQYVDLAEALAEAP
jgi:Flp pilus assembly protein TadD